MRQTLTSACSGLNFFILDPHSICGMSCRSHWEMSYAVQSNTRSLRNNKQISCQRPLHICERKSSNALDGLTYLNLRVPHVKGTLTLISLNPLVWSLSGYPPNHIGTQAFHMRDTSLLFFLTPLVQSLIAHLPEHAGSRILHTQVIASPSPWTLLIRSLSESPNNVKTFFMVRYGQ
jgi:hypothetical protein